MKSQLCLEEFLLPKLQTERLRLRMFEPTDLDAAYFLFKDREVQKYLSPTNQRSREQMAVTLQKLVGRWKERGFGIWCVTELENSRMIGYCGFQCFDKTPELELVFAFSKSFWGNGFATESAKACLKYGFENLGIEKIYAATHPENIASQKVLEKIGMDFEAESPHYQMELKIYSILSAAVLNNMNVTV